MSGGRWFAGYWDWQLKTEPRGVREMRAEIAGEAAGRVLEIGCGPGSNFQYYRASATSVVATDPNRYMLARAKERVAAAAVRVELVAASAEELPFEAGSFEAVVSTANMCTIPNPAMALAEIRRVLKPGGEYRFYDHVRYEQRFGAFVQDLLTPLWKRLLGGGCHPNRDIGRAIRDSGLDITRMERRNPVLPLPPMALVRPHIVGVARRASTP